VNGNGISPAAVVSDFDAEVKRLAQNVTPDGLEEWKSCMIQCHGNIHCGGKLKSMKDRNPAVYAALQKAYEKMAGTKTSSLTTPFRHHRCVGMNF
jgi:hypothetical protein